MSEPVLLALAALAGGVLGALYFGGLWWTVSRAVASRRPAAWFAASFAVRAGLAGGVLWLLARADLAFLLLALGGFVLARIAATRLLGRPQAASTPGQRPCS